MPGFRVVRFSFNLCVAGERLVRVRYVTTLGPLDSQAFDAVLFDMDGTLIDSIPAVVRSWVRWAQEFGVDPQNLVGMHGVPAAGVIARLLPGAEDRWAAAQARVVELEEADTADIVVLPGAIDALRALPPGRSAIATSCTKGLAAARIAATGLPVPNVLVTAEQTPVGKPSPEPYLLAAQLLGVDPSRCLVVEDAMSGIQAGRAAGCATLAVLTHLEPGSSGADAEVDNLAAVRFTSDGAGVHLSLTASA